MRVQHLQLTNFRNYGRLDLSINAGLCIFAGANAQGKTNLLEAVYYAATGRSFRNSDDAELVQWHMPEARIHCSVERDTGIADIEIRLQRKGAKRISVNGNMLRRRTDIFGYLNVVVFTPDDLQMVKGGPAERRRFLDVELAQVSPTYRHDLAEYYHVLKQRNHLLHDIAERRAGAESLSLWDEQLITVGARVMVKRAAAVQRLAAYGMQIHGAVTAQREHLEIRYQPFFAADGETGEWDSLPVIQERFVAAMQRLRHAELARGQTLLGPQRDDLLLYIEGYNVRAFGSQGQQRTSVLACKLAEIEFMRSETGEYPVLLLDDVMSELDQERRHFFLQVVTGKVQTFITTTNVHGLSPEFVAQAQVLPIIAGKVG